MQYYDDFGQPHPEPRGTDGFAFDPETLRDGTKSAGNVSFSAETLDKKLSNQAMYKFTSQDAFLSGQVPSQNLDIYNYDVFLEGNYNTEFKGGGGGRFTQG